MPLRAPMRIIAAPTPVVRRLAARNWIDAFTP
jgi:hypothetical protein